MYIESILAIHTLNCLRAQIKMTIMFCFNVFSNINFWATSILLDRAVFRVVHVSSEWSALIYLFSVKKSFTNIIFLQYHWFEFVTQTKNLSYSHIFLFA